MDIQKDKFKRFVVGDILEKIDLKYKKGLDIKKDISKIKTAEFNLPIVSVMSTNNGIMYYGRKKDFDCTESSIDIVQNGAIATGLTFVQSQPTGVLRDAYLVKLKDNPSPSVEVLIFISTCLQKVTSRKFNREKLATWTRVKKSIISLPVTSDNQLDFKYMEERIKELEEERIKELEAYLTATGLKDYKLTQSDLDILGGGK